MPFVTNEIVPDVIKQAPKSIARVNYVSGVSANLGNVLTPTQVKDQPTVEWDADAGSFYTLVMTDPDVPSRQNPEYREYRHWMVGNIPGNDIRMGEVLSEYVGPNPQEKTGLHRYVFLIYRQSGELTFEEQRLFYVQTNRSGDRRGCFSIQQFADKYNLGAPIAGNFFQAEYDDYIPPRFCSCFSTIRNNSLR